MNTPDFIFLLAVYIVSFILLTLFMGYLLGLPKIIKNSDEQKALLKEILEHLKTPKE